MAKTSILLPIFIDSLKKDCGTKFIQHLLNAKIDPNVILDVEDSEIWGFNFDMNIEFRPEINDKGWEVILSHGTLSTDIIEFIDDEEFNAWREQWFESCVMGA